MVKKIGRPRRLRLPKNWTYALEYMDRICAFSMYDVDGHIASINTMQPFMSLEKSIDPIHIERIWRKCCRFTLNRPIFSIYPIVVKFEGRLFIRDGHHRMYSALVKRHQKTMLVFYVDLSK